MSKTVIQTDQGELHKPTTKYSKGRIILRNISKFAKDKTVQRGSLVALGILAHAVGYGAVKFMTEKEVEAGPDIDNNLDSEAVVIYTEAPFASGVNDSMSFNEAFSSARAETGAGGFFEWKGNTYNTYYKEEWDSLTQEQQDSYMESMVEHTSEINTDVEDNQLVAEDLSSDTDVLDIDENPDNSNIINEAKNEVNEGNIISSHDLNNDGDIDTIMVDSDAEDGTVELFVDTDGDGNADILITDFNPETGDYDAEIQLDEGLVVNINTEDTESNTDVDNTEDTETYADVDNFDDTDLNPDYDIDNNVDMGDYV